ncbi:DUF6776 family protein [Cellvibrio polysaccharolyticus]|nr:DUF6776 family protein [Cellvibrio polysaccharolyticus]
MSVKGSTQYRMVVMPYRPMRRVFTYFLLALIFLIATGASFFFGYGHASSGGNLASVGDVPSEQFLELQEETDALRQEIANLQMASAVDKQGYDDIRREAVEQKARILELEHDITVYRGMLPTANGSNPLGISVGSLTLTGQGGVRGYKYKLLVQQLSANKEAFKGTLKFSILGTKDNKALEIPLHQVSAQASDERIPLDFKYFQNLEGELLLPEGFSAERVIIVVESSDRKKTTHVERQLDWSVTAL